MREKTENIILTVYGFLKKNNNNNNIWRNCYMPYGCSNWWIFNLLNSFSIVFVFSFNYREPVGNFLKALCANPGVDCYDLMSALTGMNFCSLLLSNIFLKAYILFVVFSIVTIMFAFIYWLIYLVKFIYPIRHKLLSQSLNGRSLLEEWASINFN